jgi:hypothetical protein
VAVTERGRQQRRRPLHKAGGGSESSRYRKRAVVTGGRYRKRAAVTGTGRSLQAAVTGSGRPLQQLQAVVTGTMPWGLRLRQDASTNFKASGFRRRFRFSNRRTAVSFPGYDRNGRYIIYMLPVYGSCVRLFFLEMVLLPALL